jgi:hypothetical protein
MWKALTADSILPYALLGMTAVTGLVDVVSGELQRWWRCLLVQR